jgi:glycosyltransferase involved in cell wall biosynthesis
VNKPLVSIITATYNSSATLDDTLRSVASQDYENIEHLIIDGGSTDSTRSIAGQYPHVGKFISEKDDGIYDAMNKGIGIATGEIIGILNSDDFYNDHQVISRVVREFETAAVDAVYGNLQYVNAIQTSKITRTWRAGAFKRNHFYYGWMPPHPTFFVRKRIYEEYGLFNTVLRSAADYELMLRFLFRHQVPVSYIPEVLVKMRAGGVSNASIRNRIKANAEDRMAWKLNGLKPYIFTLTLKPIRKITQFIIR